MDKVSQIVSELGENESDGVVKLKLVDSKEVKIKRTTRFKKKKFLLFIFYITTIIVACVSFR